MWQDLLKMAIAAKSIVGLSVAYEIATAGRLLAGVSIGAIGIVPYLWTFSKRLVERTQDPVLD